MKRILLLFCMWCIASIGYAQTYTITTVAGSTSGTAGNTGDGGAASSATFYYPENLAIDKLGNIYVVDNGNVRVRKISTSLIVSAFAGGGSSTSGTGAATTADLSNPNSVATDKNGNVYVVDATMSVIYKVSTSGTISIIAGIYNMPAHTGDSGPATAAKLYYPISIAVDTSNNIYIGEYGDSKIRKISSSGTISTIAGTGTYGYSGDGGAATAANISEPSGMAIDAAQNLYIADGAQVVIRKVNTSGIITTVAGNGTYGFAGDGGPATAGEFTAPTSLAFDRAGNMYITDSRSDAIRMVNTSGTLSTIAGTTSRGYTGDGGPATAATLGYPIGITVDTNGNVYFADFVNNVIRKLTPSCVTPTVGAISGSTTVCTGSNTTLTNSISGGVWSSTNNSLATVSTSGVVYGIATGTDTIKYTITNTCGTATAMQAITINTLPSAGTITGTLSALVGSTTTLSNSVTGGTWSTASASIASVSTGSVVTGTGYGTAVISYAVTNSCGTAYATASVSVTYPTTSGSYIITAAPGTSGLNRPSDLVFDAAGNLYIADENNRRVLKVTPSGSASVFAGNGAHSNSGDGGAATAASIDGPTGLVFDTAGNMYISPGYTGPVRKVNTSGTISTYSSTAYSPNGLVFDRSGNLYIADISNNKVFKVTPGGTTTVFAGTGTGGYSGDGSAATAAKLLAPTKMAIDTAGNIYIMDYGNNRVRKVNTSGVISTIVGSGSSGFGSGGFSGDGGPATAARINGAEALALDSAGNIYIHDYANNRIRMVNTAGIISTIAGTGTRGVTGNGGAATSAQIVGSFSIRVGTDGKIYFGDYDNIRVLSPCSTYALPAITGAATVCPGSTTTLSNATTGGTWSSSATATASVVSSTGVVRGNASGTATITYSLTNACGSFTSTASITVNPAATAGAITGAGSVCPGSTLTLTDSVTGGTWSSTNNTVATVSATGIVTGVSTGIDTIKYTVTGCGTAVATAVVTVNSLPSAGSITGTASVCLGATTTLSSSVTGGSWSSSDNTLATVDASGVVTSVAAGSVDITYSVTTACGTDYTISSITVNPLPDAGTITGVASVCPGNTTMLSASGDAGGSWSSFDASLASVDGTGTVNGIAEGYTTIEYSVTNSCGTATASVTFTVNATPDPGTITSVATLCTGTSLPYVFLGTISGSGTWSSDDATIASVSNSGAELFGYTAGTTNVTYTVTTACGAASIASAITVYPLPVAGTISGSDLCPGTSGTVTTTGDTYGTWSTSDAGIVAVDDYGNTFGMSTGTADITYTVTSSCGTDYAVTSINVGASPDAGYLSGPTSLCNTYESYSGAVQMTSTVSGGTWSSYDHSIADVDASGYLTAVHEGTAYIYYTVTNACGSADVYQSITVNPLPFAGTISGTSSICVGTNTALSTTGTAGGWFSTDPYVATVDLYTGIVTGVSEGTCSIYYYVESSCGYDLSGYYDITVISTPDAGSITSPSSICVASAARFFSSVSGGSWSSSDDAIATVDASGYVTGVTAGSVTISYTVTSDCGSATATATVTVNPLPDAGTISGAASVAVGSGIRFSPAVTGGTWSSSDATIAYIDESGSVAGIAIGTATISYTVTNSCGSATATTSISVSSVTYCTPSISGAYYSCAYYSMYIHQNLITGEIGTNLADYAGCDGSGYLDVTASTVTLAAGRSYTDIITVGYYQMNTQTWIDFNDNGSFETTEIVGGANSQTDAFSFTLAVPAGVGTGNHRMRTVTGYSPYVGNYPYIDPCGSYYYGEARDYTVNIITCTPAVVSGASSVCTGASATLTADSTGGTWSSADAAIATVNTTGSYTGVAAGSVDIIYSYTNTCGLNTTAYTVVVAPYAGVLSGITTLCAGTATAFTSSVSGGTWTTGDASVASVDGLGNVTGIAAGSVTLSYSTTTTCGTAYATTTVTVLALPVTTLADTARVCGSSLTLNEATGFAGYAWSTGETTSSITAYYPGTGWYYCTVSNGTCTTLDSQFVVINNAHIVSNDTSICAGATLVLSAEGTNEYHYGGHTYMLIPFHDDWTHAKADAISRGGHLVTITTGEEDDFISSINFANGSPTTWIGLFQNRSSSSYYEPGGGWQWVTGEAFSYTHWEIGNLDNIGGYQDVARRYPTARWDDIGDAPWYPYYLEYDFDTTFGSSWSTGATTSSISVTPTATTSYMLTTTSYGQTCTDTTTVTVTPLPSAGTISGAASVCAGATTTLSSGAAGGTWSTSNAATASVNASGIVTGIATGSAYITYTVTNSCGTATTTSSITVSPAASAGAITSATSVCVSANTTLTSSVTGGSWTTSNAAVASVNGSTGVVHGITAGIATITYSVTTTCGTAYATSSITVNPLPDAGTITGVASIAVGGTTTITASVTGGTWSSLYTSIATISAAGVAGGVSVGTDTIVYTVSNSCGSATASKALVVVSPIPTISGPSAVCIGSSITLSSTVSGGTWSSSATAYATVSSGGVVTGVRARLVTITYTVGSALATYAVTVQSSSVLGIAGATSVCVGSSTTLTDGTAGGSWLSSNTALATVSSTGVVYGVMAGTDTIFYTVANTCGTFSVRKTIVVTGTPTVSSISGSTASICAGSTNGYSITTGSGVWSLSNTTIGTVTSSGTSATVRALAGGVDTLKYTVTNSCGFTAVATRTITFNSAPYVSAIDGPTTVSVGSSITLTDSVSGGVWSHTAPSVASLSSTGLVTGLSAGVDTIKYTVTNSCGNVTVAKVVTVNAVTIAITGPTAVCVGSTITLSSSVSGGTWSSSATAYATVSSAGVVRGVVTGNVTITYTLGSTRATYPVAIQGASVASIAGASSVCPDATTTYTDATAGGTWSNAFSATGTINASGVYAAVTSGTDTIIYNVTNACGSYVTRKTITITGTPFVTAISAVTGNGCLGTNNVLRDIQTGGVWSFSDTTIARIVSVSSPSVTVTGITTGVTTLSYTVTNSCGLQGSATTRITINDIPALSAITGASTVVTGSTITLATASTGGTWSSGSTAIATVNPGGIVRGVSAGSSAISYSKSNTCGTNRVVKVVTVVSSKPAGSGVTAGVSDVVNVFPNPSNGLITIAANATIGKVYVTDLSGKLVQEANGGAFSLDVDLSNYASGTYLIRVITENGVTDVKVTKK